MISRNFAFTSVAFVLVDGTLTTVFGVSSPKFTPFSTSY